MSIYVVFQYAPASSGQQVEEKYASSQAMAFVEQDKAVQEILGVYAPFTAEYLAHLEEEHERAERLTSGLTETDRIGAYQEIGHALSWLEGSTPFRPEALMEWATRWRQLLDCASEDELAELLCGVTEASALPMWDFMVGQWKCDMDRFQELARQAMADGVLLTMSTG